MEAAILLVESHEPRKAENPNPAKSTRHIDFKKPEYEKNICLVGL